MKTICDQAAKKNYLQHDPFLFSDLKFKPEKPKRTTLSETEILMLHHKKIENDKLKLHRDHFIFMCLTGLYYSDFKLLTNDDLVTTEKGMILTNQRIKTNNTFIIPLWLFPRQMKLLNKYYDSGTINPNELLFSNTITDQQFNLKLKSIAEITKLSKNLTNKVARHSFTDLCISKGIARQFVSKMLGHSQESTTQQYYEMNVSHVMRGIDSYKI